MGTVNKTKQLIFSLKKKCVGYDAQEIGVAFSSILVEVAKAVGIQKSDFMGMLNELWEFDEAGAENEDVDENEDFSPRPFPLADKPTTH